MNVIGMEPLESDVSSYVHRTGNHVLYRVTPIFDGKNLLSSGVQMEAWSVEDKGRGICFNIYCFNVQPGIMINYKTGESHLSVGSNGSSSITGRHDSSQNNAATDSKAWSFVINTNTKKFHLPTCSSVGEMKSSNKMTHKGTVQDIIDMGYKPCARCLRQYR